MVQAQYMEEEEEQEEDDITEIREGEEADYYDDYQEFEEQQQQQPAAPPSAGSQLMGLVCPTCRQMCKGVQALKEHMALCKGGGGREPAEELQDSLCHICDKSFKNHRTLDNHLKKQHGLAGSSRALGGNRGRGRPKKSPAMSDWGGESYEGGYQEPGLSQQPLHRGRPVGQVAPQRVSEAAVPLPRPGQHGSSSPRGARGRGMPRGGFSR